ALEVVTVVEAGVFAASAGEERLVGRGGLPWARGHPSPLLRPVDLPIARYALLWLGGPAAGRGAKAAVVVGRETAPAAAGGEQRDEDQRERAGHPVDLTARTHDPTPRRCSRTAPRCRRNTLAPPYLRSCWGCRCRRSRRSNAETP